MAFRQPGGKDAPPLIGVEAEQAQFVGDRRLCFSEPLCDLQLGDAPFVHQSVDRLGLLEGVEIRSLHVLDQAEHGGAAVVGMHFNAGHAAQPRQPRGAKPPFSGDEIPAAVRPLANRKRLEQTVAADALAQAHQRLFVEHRPRLIGAGMDQAQGEHDELSCFLLSSQIQKHRLQLVLFGQV